MTDQEIPTLYRPVRFVVLLGKRGAVRSDNLEDLQERLAQPWSPDEVEESADDRAMLSSAEREVRQIASEFRRHGQGGDRQRHKGGRSDRGPRGRSDFRKRRRGR